MNTEDSAQLIHDIATRAGTGKELARKYGLTSQGLKAFLSAHYADIDTYAERQKRAPTNANIITPMQLDDLWVTNKFERLKRYQQAAEMLFKDIQGGGLVGTELATSLREFRSYLTVVANELGQLLHRGSGESSTGDTLGVEIEGIDLGSLK